MSQPTGPNRRAVLRTAPGLFLTLMAGCSAIQGRNSGRTGQRELTVLNGTEMAQTITVKMYGVSDEVLYNRTFELAKRKVASPEIRVSSIKDVGITVQEGEKQRFPFSPDNGCSHEEADVIVAVFPDDVHVNYTC